MALLLPKFYKFCFLIHFRESFIFLEPICRFRNNCIFFTAFFLNLTNFAKNKKCVNSLNVKIYCLPIYRISIIINIIQVFRTIVLIFMFLLTGACLDCLEGTTCPTMGMNATLPCPSGHYCLNGTYNDGIPCSIGN